MGDVVERHPWLALAAVVASPLITPAFFLLLFGLWS